MTAKKTAYNDIKELVQRFEEQIESHKKNKYWLCAASYRFGSCQHEAKKGKAKDLS